MIDDDRARAAAILSALEWIECELAHVNGVADLDQASGSYQVVLAADRSGSISTLLERPKQLEISAKVIAFGEGPSTHHVVKAITSGAVDYLDWPSDAAVLVSAVLAASRVNVASPRALASPGGA